MLPLRDTTISKKTPTARIITFIPILIFPWFVRIPDIIFFVSVVFSLTVVWAHLHDNVERGSDGVAWWAQIGSFIVGFFMALPTLMMNRKKITYRFRTSYIVQYLEKERIKHEPERINRYQHSF